ncbi:unnamed protein product [Rhizophagus irregularis]|nr:unnamed protein product [Rhizophagus irregularis]
MFHVTRLESIPNVSTLEILWANLQQKNYDEIEDLIQRRSGDHGIYFSYFGSVSIASPEYAKILLTESEDDATKFEPDPGSFLDKFFGSGLPFANGDKWRTHRNLANSAFNIALSPEIVGETTMDLFAFMKPKLNRPIDVYETMQRVTIEALGKLGFGHKFGCLESEGVSHLISSYKYVVSIVGSPLYRHDSTSIALSVSLYFLAKYPEMQEKARAEVINILAWPLYSTNKYYIFLSSEKRHAYSWVTFSSGPRNCVGQNLSLMEQRIILSMIRE